MFILCGRWVGVGVVVGVGWGLARLENNLEVHVVALLFSLSHLGSDEDEWNSRCVVLDFGPPLALHIVE